MKKLGPVSIIDKVSDEDFADIVASSCSVQSIAKAVGYRVRSGVVRNKIMARIVSAGSSTTHFEHLNREKISKGKRTHELDSVLVIESNYSNISRLKKRLVSEGRKEYKCESCLNSGEWNGKRLALQLDHKNGVPDDHRVENLRFLCPNCHSQTENFCGRNKLAVK